MELSLIIVIAIFLILIYVIFKLIKKIIFAFVTVFVLFFVIYFGAVFLVYADVNNLVSNNEYDLDIIYEDDSSYLFGLRVPYDGSNLSADDFSSINIEDLDSLVVDELSSDDERFVVTVSNVFFEEVLDDIEYDFSIGEYDLYLEKRDILDLISKESTVSELSSKLGADSEDFLVMLSTKLEESNVGVREYVFMVVFEQSIREETNAIKFIDAYKDDEINIYPNRATFRLLKWLPDSNLKGLFESESEE